MIKTEFTNYINEKPEDIVIGFRYFPPSYKARASTVLIMNDHNIIQYQCDLLGYKKTSFGIRKNISIKGIILTQIFFNGSWKEYPIYRQDGPNWWEWLETKKVLQDPASEVVKIKLDRNLSFIKNSSSPNAINIKISGAGTLPVEVKYVAEKTIFLDKYEYEIYKREEGMRETVCRKQIEKDGETLLHVLSI